jgi:4-amino-4-deoxy-L-arabinose transferase-like glycosyltransferase
MAAVLVMALAARVTAALLIDAPPRSDAAEYLELARSIAAGEGYAIGGHPTAYRAPGYPLVVAAILLASEDSLTAVRLVQAILDSITCAMVFLLGRRLASEGTGVRAALIYALFPLQILYVTSVMTETLFTMLLTGTVLVLVSPRMSVPRLALAGLLGGCAVLVKPTALVLPILVFVAPSVMRKGLRMRAAMMAVFVGGMVAVITPWLLRNQAEFGRVALTSNTGVNFWIGNHPGANGAYSYPGRSPLEEVQGEFQRSDAGVRLGLTSWVTHPGSSMLTMIKKHAHLFGIDYWILLSSSPETAQESSRPARSAFAGLPLWAIAVVHLPVVVVVALALVALAGMPREYSHRWIMVLTLILAWIVIHLVFFGAARFRVPLHPFLILAALSGWEMLRSRTLSVHGSRLWILVVWGLLLVGGWGAEFWLLSSLR